MRYICNILKLITKKVYLHIPRYTQNFHLKTESHVIKTVFRVFRRIKPLINMIILNNKVFNSMQITDDIIAELFGHPELTSELYSTDYIKTVQKVDDTMQLIRY